MSRSYLRNKWMRKITDGRSFFRTKSHIMPRNKHRQDEMPKNQPSRYIVERIGFAKVYRLQEPGSFGGHKPHKGGHARVSGLVRAKVKAEYRKQINSELNEQ